MPSLTLDDALRPIPTAEFLKDYVGKKFLYLPGEPGKFKSLFDWRVLNQVLQTQRFTAPRLRLVHEGHSVPATQYTRDTALRPAAMTELLRSGATLVLDSVEELNPPLTEFAQRVEKAIEARVQVNLYCGWRVYPGFDVHWDGHDVVVLQIAGRKQWKVYGETEPFPLKNSVEAGKKPPKTDPIWEGVLTDGDLLYLPRGWWHVAIPCDEPTLHLTMGMNHHVGMDLVRWVTERLEADVRMRTNVPMVADDATKAAYQASIQSAIRDAFNGPDLLQQFIDSRNHLAPPRPTFGFPWSGRPEVLPDSDSYIITLLLPRKLEMRPRDGVAIDIPFNGSLFTFAAAAEPLFLFLRDHLPATIGEFYEKFKAEFGEETLRDFLIQLTKYGVIGFREPISTAYSVSI
jgi:ribosomal protein L16 Arg81 hydroxylase